MPGIAAIFSRSEPETNEQQVRTMVATMNHEPFYTSGTFNDRQLGVYVGWTCHPGSYSDCMPIFSADRNFVLFFYGEHHDGEGDASVLDAASAQMGCAAELVESFARRGLDVLPRLNGWFHGILLDRQRNLISVFNDRYAMQRLYIANDGQTFLLASEAKALLAVRREFKELAPRGVAELLTCGAVLEGRTLFKGVDTLPAASQWQFRPSGSVTKTRYFDAANWENQVPLSEPALQERLRDVLLRATKRSFASRLPVAISLTGGYDTRMIMANAGSTRGTMRCYTFGGPYRDCFDVKIAREIAALCDCQHEVLRLDDRFFHTFPQLAAKTVHISDGNLAACNAYELYLNTKARRIAPVKITGSFGSEVMRGSRAFGALHPDTNAYQPGFHEHLKAAVETFQQIDNGRPLSFSVYKQAPWYYFNRLAIEQSQVVVRTPYMDNELVGLMYRSSDGHDRRDMAIRLIRAAKPLLANLPTDTGNTWWLKGWVLHLLFQADYCYKSGMPQWLEQVHYMCRPLRPERMLIGLHRFQHFRIWFRSHFSDYVRDMLLDRRTLQREYFDEHWIQYIVERHIKGDRNYTDAIERVLSIELIHRTLLEPANSHTTQPPTVAYAS